MKFPAIRRMGDGMIATARLEARLPVKVHELLKYAAGLQGRTLTDFVVTAAQEAAEKAIRERQIIELSIEDQRRFVEALLNPPEPNDVLREDFALHRANVIMK